MATSINDILISELDRASVPAQPEDELVINQEVAGGDYVTRKISWAEVGQSIRDLSGGITNAAVMFSDGTEPEPSITFKNDTSTGIYRQTPIGYPSMGISAGGYEVIRATRTAKGCVGINFVQTQDIPQDGLHIKDGGIILDYNNLVFRVTNDYTPTIENPLKYNANIRLGCIANHDVKFITNDKERGRFTNSGNFLFHGSLGVGGYFGETYIDPEYGNPPTSKKSGSILISNGFNFPVTWRDPEDFFVDNVYIITEILGQYPDFIQIIADQIGNITIDVDDLNIGDGLARDTRPSAIPGVTERYMYVDDTIVRGIL